MTFNFKEIIIVEQIADGYNTTSTYKLKTAYTNHVDQIEAFGIPKEKIDEHLLNGVSQFTTTNRHGEQVVYTLIRSTN